jgi:hypothetical protein
MQSRDGDFPMLRDHIINFLETAIVFLLLTNAVSAAAAISAMRLLNLRADGQRKPTGIERRLNLILGLKT